MSKSGEEKLKKKKFKQKRKAWYRGLKQIMKIRYKKTKFIFLGDKPSEGSIILSNHEGTDAPMALEIYAEFPVRMWGTAEMNSGIKKLYKYQTQVYYHEKKHWNLHLARLFCLLASPLTNLFYKGLNLISTYQDARFKTTINESIKSIVEKKENLVIFPEKSPDGYMAHIQGFYAGFTVLAQTLYKQGYDAQIYVSYFKKKERVYIFDKPILFSTLKSTFSCREDITQYLVDRCNALGTLDVKSCTDKKDN